MEAILTIAGGIFLGLLLVVAVIWLLLWSFVRSRRGAMTLLKFQKDLVCMVVFWLLSKIFPKKRK